MDEQETRRIAAEREKLQRELAEVKAKADAEAVERTVEDLVLARVPKDRSPGVAVRELAGQCIRLPDGRVVHRDPATGVESPAESAVEAYLTANPIFGWTAASSSSAPSSSGAGSVPWFATVPSDDPKLLEVVERDLAGAPSPAMRRAKPIGKMTTPQLESAAAKELAGAPTKPTPRLPLADMSLDELTEAANRDLGGG